MHARLLRSAKAESGHAKHDRRKLFPEQFLHNAHSSSNTPFQAKPEPATRQVSPVKAIALACRNPGTFSVEWSSDLVKRIRSQECGPHRTPAKSVSNRHWSRLGPVPMSLTTLNDIFFSHRRSRHDRVMMHRQADSVGFDLLARSFIAMSREWRKALRAWGFRKATASPSSAKTVLNGRPPILPANFSAWSRSPSTPRSPRINPLSFCRTRRPRDFRLLRTAIAKD